MATRPMTRYRTRSYVAVSEDEARRLSKLDNTAWPDVKITPDVSLIHVEPEGYWAFWSDGRLTTSIGLPKNLRPTDLSKDAAYIISILYGSDSGKVDIPGGWAILPRLKKILSRKRISTGESRGVYARPVIEEYVVKLDDDSEHTWYSYSEGYFEGYVFDLFDSLSRLHESLERNYPDES